MPEDFAVEYPEGQVFRATAPQQPGWRCRLTAGQIRAVLDGAVASAKIPPARRAYYAARLAAGGRVGGEALAVLMQLHPADPATAAAWDADPAGVRAAAAGQEALYEALYPDEGPPGSWQAAAGGAVPGHGPVAAQHDHEHAAYDGSGGTHAHEHTHIGDAGHAPGAAHPHDDPAAAGSGDGEEAYASLYPTGQQAADAAERRAAQQAATRPKIRSYDNQLRAAAEPPGMSGPDPDRDLYESLFGE